MSGRFFDMQKLKFGANNGNPIMYLDESQLKSVDPARLRDVHSAKYWDTKRLDSGTINADTEFDFFNIPSGQNDTTVGGGTSYTKLITDTNIRGSKQLPNGFAFLVTGISCVVREALAVPTARGNANSNYNLATNLLETSVIENAPTKVSELVRRILLTCVYGEKPYEVGLLEDFPAHAIISGFAGGQATTVAATTTVAEGIVQNGVGKPWMLEVPHLIRPLRTFYARARVGMTLALPTPLELRLVYHGLEFSSLQ
jgi:hypothetical protein